MLNVSVLDTAPLALTVTVAPLVTGSPAIVPSVPVSLAWTVTFRLMGVLGFLITSYEPRIVWSAAWAAGRAGRTKIPRSSRRRSIDDSPIRCWFGPERAETTITPGAWVNPQSVEQHGRTTLRPERG